MASTSLPVAQHSQLERYAELLLQWNAKINLISRRDVDRLWTRHIDESLELAPLLEGEEVLDVGSGGGLPGMVLAIACPDRRFTLMERSERKCRFLRHVVIDLGLTNVSVINCDFTEQQTPQFSCVVARAVATPAVLWPQLQPWLAPGGTVLVATGPRARDELPTDPAATIEWVTPVARQAADLSRQDPPPHEAQRERETNEHDRAVVRLRANPDAPHPEA